MSDITSILGTQSGAGTNPLAQNSALTGPAGGTMGKDEFLKLLIAQMQNQDPLNPMDGMQFASQLAQFSSVEQLTQLNSAFADQAAAQSAMLSSVNGSVAVSTFGREVVAVGDQISVGGDQKPQALFDAPEGGGRAKVHILNAAGNEVDTVDLGYVDGGFQTADLSGATAHLPAGTYTYQVGVADQAGSETQVQTYMSGKVDGVRYTSDGPVLTAGGITIPFGSILRILQAD
jgi:flagellar basal-body rod modification protein FlgD